MHYGYNRFLTTNCERGWYDMSRTFRELAYERQNRTPQAKDAYETLLEQVRAAISRDHAETLAQSITEKDAAETVKRLIGEHISGHQLHVNGLSMQQLTDKLYGDMAGFGLTGRNACFMLLVLALKKA